MLAISTSLFAAFAVFSAHPAEAVTELVGLLPSMGTNTVI